MSRDVTRRGFVTLDGGASSVGTARGLKRAIPWLNASLLFWLRGEGGATWG